MVFCLLSNFLLFNTRYVRYLMAFWCMFFMSFLTLFFGMLMSSSFVMDTTCDLPTYSFNPQLLKAFSGGIGTLDLNSHMVCA